MALARDVLWAAEVNVYSVTVGLNDFCGSQEGVRVVRAELDDERPVPGTALFAEGYIEHLVAMALPHAFRKQLHSILE